MSVGFLKLIQEDHCHPLNPLWTSSFKIFNTKIGLMAFALNILMKRSAPLSLAPS